MADWPIIGCTTKIAPQGDYSAGLICGTNSKGDWEEKIASAPQNISGLIVQYVSGYAGSFLCDIGVGAAGSEVVIVPDIPYCCLGFRNNECLYVPVSIPAGSRVSIRGSYTGGSTAGCTMAIYPVIGALHPSFSQVDAYGVVAAASTGTQIDPGTSAGTKGAWVEIGTSLGITMLALGICGFDSYRTTGYWWLDIGIGSAGNETVVMSDFTLSCNSSHDQITPGLFGFFPFSIPAGARITARAASDITNSDRYFNLVFLGAR